MYRRKKNQNRYDPQTGQLIPQPIQQTNKKQLTNGEEININTPFEYIAGQIPRRALSFLILATAGLIGMLGLIFVNYFIIGTTDIVTTLVYAIQGIIAIIFFFQAFLIFKYVLKKGEMAIVREHRGGIISFDKHPLTKPLRFNKKDPSSEITILWNGSGTEKQSGSRVLLLKEGNKANENINLCVPETEWSKNLASMVKAKTFADIAEAELLNQKSLLGIKWQDLVLILIAVFVIIAIVIQIGLVPELTAGSVIDALNGGALQNVLKSIVSPVVPTP